MTGNMEWKLEHMDKIWGKMGGGKNQHIKDNIWSFQHQRLLSIGSKRLLLIRT